MKRFKIFAENRATVAMVAVMILVSGCGSVVVAQSVGDAKEAAETIAGMSAQSLLALISLASMGFAAWIFWRMTETLRRLSMDFSALKNELANRPCIYRDKTKGV